MLPPCIGLAPHPLACNIPYEAAAHSEIPTVLGIVAAMFIAAMVSAHIIDRNRNRKNDDE